MRKIPEIIKIASRNLRKNMTEAEENLWEQIKARKLHGLKFGKQSPTYVFTEDSGLDRYVIPDFLCSEYKLIIELDGSIHDRKNIYLLDREKEKLLTQSGFKIIRFQNDEIFQDLEKVLQKITTLCSCKE